MLIVLQQFFLSMLFFEICFQFDKASSNTYLISIFWYQKSRHENENVKINNLLFNRIILQNMSEDFIISDLSFQKHTDDSWQEIYI